ncbi:MAG: hypothetical protein ACI8QZ_002093 [Chlamydiales bacterium]
MIPRARVALEDWDHKGPARVAGPFLYIWGMSQPQNHLAGETSPYLLQHAHNPVAWYPWGPEALELARAQDRPIFLSIGYSACHWCHVMERESFENDSVAALMNEHFVNIKVDREERPDLDEIYMKAVQRLSGSGGWPMSVFLTPALEPFFGGTYFPPFSKYGRPGFSDVLSGLARAWGKDRDKVLNQAAQLTEGIAREGQADTRGKLSPEVLDQSLAALTQSFDSHWGGFGDAPKFPHAMDIRMCLRHHLRTGKQEALHMATFTLDKMAQGGIFDQLGGGFHRYSTDEQWLIPHFEKMLYDNALLIPAYLEAYLVTEDERYAQVARECCEWVLREMITPEGGFASTQDADSEGEEGRFFAWTPEELNDVLGEKLGGWAQEWFDVTDGGNFEGGTSALWRKDTDEQVAARLTVAPDELRSAMAEASRKLFEARDKRIKPGWDDKVLAAWNGLMISAMAMAYQVLDDERYLDAARTAARYLLDGMRTDEGRLLATARNGKAHLNACLDDYTFSIAGLIDLYESDFDDSWLRNALALTEIVEQHFHDGEHGGYFTTSDDHETLIARLKNPHDGALPSGNAVHALSLLRLAELSGSTDLAQRAQATIDSVGSLVHRYPSAFGQMLAAVDFVTSGPRELVVAGEASWTSTRDFLKAIRKTFQPARVVALANRGSDETLMPLLEGREAAEGEQARGYVCRNYACQAPMDSAVELERELKE